MASTNVHLHGGPLDGTVRPVPVGPDGQPAERIEIDHHSDGRWYIEYERARHGEDGWRFPGDRHRAARRRGVAAGATEYWLTGLPRPSLVPARRPASSSDLPLIRKAPMLPASVAKMTTE